MDTASKGMHDPQRVLMWRLVIITAILFGICIAVLAVSQGNPTAALNRLEVVLHSDPENPRALFYRAVALDQVQRKDEATDVLQKLAGAGKGKYSERAQRYLEERTGSVS